MIDDNNIFDPKPKSSFKDWKEKTIFGNHLYPNHKNKALKKANETDWKTNAHAPKPLYAKKTPIIPDNKTEIKEYFACDLKSINKLNLTLCTTIEALKIIPTVITLKIIVRPSILKKLSIKGAEKIK